jgi:hypothetical protein
LGSSQNSSRSGVGYLPGRGEKTRPFFCPYLPKFVEQVLEGEELLHEAHGENYERLVVLKDKYDPTNLFRLNHNIKPTV